MTEQRKEILNRNAEGKIEYAKSLEWAKGQEAHFSCTNDLMYGLVYSLKFYGTPKDITDALGFAQTLVIRGDGAGYPAMDTVILKKLEPGLGHHVELSTYNADLFMEVLNEIEPVVKELPAEIEKVMTVGMEVLNYIEDD